MASEAEALELVRMVGFPSVHNPLAAPYESEALLRGAFENKIPLLYLRALKSMTPSSPYAESYRSLQETLGAFEDALSGVTAVLSGAGIRYAVFKTQKPFPYVPGDLDILLLDGNFHYVTAVAELLRAGFQPVVEQRSRRIAESQQRDVDRTATELVRPTYGMSHVSPNSIDLLAPESGVPVDLQVYFGMSYLVFVQPSRIEGTDQVPLWPGRVSAPGLEAPAEMAIVILHSVLEQLFLLSEFYTLSHYLERYGESGVVALVRFCQTQRIESALRAFVTVCAVLCLKALGHIPGRMGDLVTRLQVDQTLERPQPLHLPMPYRYSVRNLLALFAEKCRDPIFARSVASQAIHMVDPRLFTQVFRHVMLYRTRHSYGKGPHELK